MIDTLNLTLPTAHPVPALNALQPSCEPFAFDGLTADLATISARSHFARQGWPLYLRAYNPELGISVAGPVRRTLETGALFLPHIVRLNVARLAGLPDGCLPTCDADIQRALNHAVALLPWLPPDWLDQAEVRQVDLAQNFALDPAAMLALHINMRHARVRSNPFKSDPTHGSLYWKGSQLVICLYDKSRQLNQAAARMSGRQDAEPVASYAPFIRLEFRLQRVAATRCLDHAVPLVPQPSPQPGAPPLPVMPRRDFGLADITAPNLFAMFRHLVGDFPHLPLRRPERLTVPTLVAVGLQHAWTLRDGRTVLDYYSEFATPQQVRRAQKLALTVDTTGGPVFSWLDVVPADGWGPYARPTVTPLPPAGPCS